jgi:hypothetical protein
VSGEGTDPAQAPPAPRAGLATLVRDLFAFDRRAATVLVYVPIALTAMEYLFLPPLRYKQPSPAWVLEAQRALARAVPALPPTLWPWAWWGLGCVAVMILVPMLLLRLVAHTGPRATGMRLRGTGRDAFVYLALFLVFAPVVWLASRRADFAQTYPFYPPASVRKVGGDWVAFEAIYFLQFLAVEYFFRGFMVLGLKPSMGRAAILVMLAPYCMIHFHKPGLEALGAVGAGVVLGSLSYRTGTVLYGWFLHYAVALSMDLLSLTQSGRL